ncbi:MAG TPA: DUF3558 domain-containing protein [Pseudonocardiaceae bacterium]|nr:DUF3558 domain-containing protein [Pseudonocardiaceae bacterium]
MKRLVVLAGLAAILVGASACTNPTPGQASGVTTTTGSQPGDTSSPSGGGGTALPVDHACSLLSSSDLQQLGASSPPTEEMVGTAHSCDFDSDDYTFGVAIRTNVGLSGFVATGSGPVKDMSIGGHQAKQEVGNSGACVIGIGVSDTSRVDLTVLPAENQDPCPTALKLANIIEPKLP